MESCLRHRHPAGPRTWGSLLALGGVRLEEGGEHQPRGGHYLIMCQWSRDGRGRPAFKPSQRILVLSWAHQTNLSSNQAQPICTGYNVNLLLGNCLGFVGVHLARTTIWGFLGQMFKAHNHLSFAILFIQLWNALNTCSFGSVAAKTTFAQLNLLNLMACHCDIVSQLSKTLSAVKGFREPN